MKLSIVIPTLNEEKVLERTLKSLKQLNGINYEIIVSDGGSADSTLQIAESFADIVVKHLSQERQNISQGRNAGANIASGEYILFLDADVIIPDVNNFFTKALELFEADPKLSGLTVFLKVLPEHITISDNLFFWLVNLQIQLMNNIFHVGAAAGEFQMMPLRCFRQIGGYDPNLIVGEDFDLFRRLSLIGKTRSETGLHVFHTSRRAHGIGWPKLLFLWILNFTYIKIFKRSFSKEWKPIR